MKSIGDRLNGLQLALENNKPPNTLFDVEPAWEMLKEERCPICGTKLSLVPRVGPERGICRGRRHGDKKPFVIAIGKLKGTIRVH